MITQARLKELLHYDPDTGVFTRLGIAGRNGSTRSVGSVAGSVSKSTGYVRITVDYQEYLAHRLAWLYMTGEWPDLKIDHKNTVKTDNRWLNLRKATDTQNAANRKAKATSATGLKGVTPESGKWRAEIKVGGKSKRLGLYSTPELAAKAYADAASKIHGEFAHQSS